MREFPESDWKLYRKHIAAWQENYMDKLNLEYIEILSQDIKPSSKFWEIEKRIRQDKRHPGVVVQMSRSTMLENIAIMVSDNVISMDDLEEFSDDIKEAVKLFVWGRR